MLCKSCGHELDDNAIFCTNCGAKLNAPDNTPAPEDNTQPAEPAPIAEENNEQPVIPTETEPKTETKTEPESNDENAVTESVEPIQEAAPILPIAEEAAETTPAAAEQFKPEAPVFSQPVNEQTVGIFSDPVQPQPTNDAPFVPFSEPAPNGEPADVFAPEAAETAPTAEKTKTKVGAGRLTFAAIMTIVTIFFLIVLNIALCVKFGASGTVLSKRIKKLDINTILSAEYEDEEIATDIYRTLGIRSITDGNANESSFKSYLMRSNALDFISGNVKNYADYIFEGKGSDPSIDSEVIAKEFFGDKDNNKIANQEFGYSLTSKDLNNIKKNLEKNDVDDALSIKHWSDEAEFNLKNCRHIFSFVTIGILFGIVLVMLICIILIVDRRGRHVMGFYGNVFSISGLITFIAGLAIVVVLPAVYTFHGNVILYISANLLFGFGLAALCAGFIEILLGCLFHFIKRRLKKKAAKAE